MPLRSYKATSPGLRQMTRSTFEEITTDEPHKPLLEPQIRGSGRNNAGPPDRPPSRRRREAALPPDRLQARQVRRAGPARDDRVRPEPVRAHRPAPLPRRREALHAPAARPEGRRRRRRRSATPRRGSATPCRWRTSRSARRSTTSSSIPGKGGQIVRSAGTSAQLLAKEGELRPGPPAVGRDAPRPDALHGHRRPGRQPRSREPEPRQGRPCPPHGPAARRSAASS